MRRHGCCDPTGTSESRFESVSTKSIEATHISHLFHIIQPRLGTAARLMRNSSPRSTPRAEPYGVPALSQCRRAPDRPRSEPSLPSPSVCPPPPAQPMVRFAVAAGNRALIPRRRIPDAAHRKIVRRISGRHLRTRSRPSERWQIDSGVKGHHLRHIPLFVTLSCEPRRARARRAPPPAGPFHPTVAPREVVVRGLVPERSPAPPPGRRSRGRYPAHDEPGGGAQRGVCLGGRFVRVDRFDYRTMLLGI